MRIIAGAHRGRPLTAPAGQETRPTGDRMRQSLFNILANASWSPIYWPETIVLDAFAGSGALGFEALSRGAVHAVLVDHNKAALQAMHQNAEYLGVKDQCSIIAATMPNLPTSAPHQAHLVFLDPPYRQNLVHLALVGCAQAGWLADDCLAVVETGADENLLPPDGWVLCDRRIMGKSALMFWRR